MFHTLLWHISCFEKQGLNSTTFDADGLSRIIVVDCPTDSSEVVGDSQAEMDLFLPAEQLLHNTTTGHPSSPQNAQHDT